jgi:hypothetical protein
MKPNVLIVEGDFLQAANLAEVVDGKICHAARKLIQNDIQVIFVSANARASLPDDLRKIPFLAKPFVPGHLGRLSMTLSLAFAQRHAQHRKSKL